MAQAMFELALQQPGCLGAESARNPEGFGITAAYFTDEAAIAKWKPEFKALGGAAARQGVLVLTLPVEGRQGRTGLCGPRRSVNPTACSNAGARAGHAQGFVGMDRVALGNAGLDESDGIE